MTRAGAETFIETNGIRLHTVLAGPEDGPLVLLLHGFPDFWYGWRHQIGPLAAAGYRLMIPDQRGYNTSDKPPGVAAYRLQEAAADVAGLIEAAGRTHATIIGHDWGAAVGWWIAVHEPSRLERLAVLNVAHPAVMRRQLLRNIRQLLRSWYGLFFQIPLLPPSG